MTHRLFSYGTLRQADVQAVLFGRPVLTVEDTLPGYKLDWLVIADPEVIATSGSDRHPILRRGSEGDAVRGAYLELSDDELACADEYEVDDYVRRSVVLASEGGLYAFIGFGLGSELGVLVTGCAEEIESALWIQPRNSQNLANLPSTQRRTDEKPRAAGFRPDVSRVGGPIGCG